jgi:YVTN family beta-propeller protein
VHTATVLRSISLAGYPPATQMSLGDGVVWVRFDEGSVGRIDLTTNAITAQIPVGSGEFGELTVGDNAVWVTTFDTDKLSRIDPATNAVVAEITVGSSPDGVTVTPGAVWVSNHHGGSVWRVDPATNAVVAKVQIGPVGSGGPKAISQAFGDLWTSVPNAGLVVRMDQETNEVIATIEVPIVEDLLIGEDVVYATDGRGQVNEIQPASNKAIHQFYPANLPWLVGLGGFWSAQKSDLLRLEPPTFVATELWHVPGVQTGYAALAFDDKSAWLLTEDNVLLQVGFAQ